MSHERPILIVEDDADVRESMRLLLELEGFAAETACDGQEALDKLRCGMNPCLILLDLMMPRMDGFQFVNEKRQDPTISSIPVLVYSGHYDATANAAKLGAEGYVQKPVEPGAFLRLIRLTCARTC